MMVRRKELEALTREMELAERDPGAWRKEARSGLKYMRTRLRTQHHVNNSFRLAAIAAGDAREARMCEEYDAALNKMEAAIAKMWADLEEPVGRGASNA